MQFVVYHFGELQIDLLLSYYVLRFRQRKQTTMSVRAKDLDTTVTPMLCVQTLKVISRVNARMDGPVTVLFAQVFTSIHILYWITNIELEKRTTILKRNDP